MPAHDKTHHKNRAVDNLPPLRAVIAEHNLKAHKRFGQNFILDLNLTRRIARAGGDLSDNDIIEIGAGPGGLTRSLLMENAHKVIVIEPDTRFEPALRAIATAYPNRVEIITSDARHISLDELTPNPYKIIANLPYNIATSLLIRWLKQGWKNNKWAPRWQSMTLLFQKEVARRIVAQPNTSAYGRLSVLTGWLCERQLCFDIDPQAFVPTPKVTSSLVYLLPHKVPLYPAALEQLEKCTAAAFGQRRKMLRASLKQVCSKPEALLQEGGIDATLRAENLSIEEFCTLARLIG